MSLFVRTETVKKAVSDNCRQRETAGVVAG